MQTDVDAASAAKMETATPAAPAPTASPGTAAGAATSTPAAPTQPASAQAAADSLNCTYSAGFWLANPQRWLTDNLVIGSLTYSRARALEILALAPQDISTQVLQEFFATALNILKGADAQAIQLELSQSGEWIRQHPNGLLVAGEALQQGQQLASRLGAYNHGEIGPGRCSDEPALPTPTATFTATPSPMPTATRPAQDSGGNAPAPTRARPGQPGNPPPTNPPPTQAPPTQPPATQALPTQPPATQAPPTQPPATQPPATQAPPPPPTPAPPTPAPPPTATPQAASPEPAVTP